LVVIVGNRTKVEVFPAAEIPSATLDFVRSKQEEEESDTESGEDKSGDAETAEEKQSTDFWKSEIKTEIERRYNGGLSRAEKSRMYFWVEEGWEARRREMKR
jgi:hypothetical protein